MTPETSTGTSNADRRRLDRDHWPAIDSAWNALEGTPAASWDRELMARFPGRPDLRDRVHSLLRATAPAADPAPDKSPNGEGTDDESSAAAARPQAPRRVSPAPSVAGYDLLRQLGAGGMGTVYLARPVPAASAATSQRFTSPGAAPKLVAIKILRADVDREALARFERERRILARLEHPGIARFLGEGTTAEGQPFLVIEHVDGLPIDRFAGRQALSPRARVELIHQVCKAIDDLHQNMVLHLDLKPHNILVTADGKAMLLDFGIAKLLDPGTHDGATTLAGRRWLTPRYAAPEQLAGEPPTTRSDVYSLGVVLFELLTGRSPYGLSSEAPASEVERAVRAGALPRPSTVVRGEVIAGQAVGTNVQVALSGDLDAIVSRALATDPRERYGSARELGDDLFRYLQHLPVRARRTAPLELGRKFLRRNRWTVVASLVLASGLGGAYWASQRERAGLELQRNRADRTVDLLMRTFELSNPRLISGPAPPAERGRLLGQAAQALADPAVAADPLGRARVLHALGRLQIGLGAFGEAATSLDESYDLYRQSLGLLHETTLEVLEHRAEVDLYRGQPDLAEPRLRVTLALQLEALGPTHLEVADTYEALGTSSVLAGRPLEGQQHFAKALAIRLPQMAATEPELIESYDDLGWAKLAAGDLAGAETFFERVRLAREANRDPELATTLTRYGLVRYRQGRKAEARAMLERALALRVETFGENYPSNQFIMANLYELLAEAGDAAAAEEMALRAHRAAIVIGDPRTLLVSRINLAGAHRVTAPAIAEQELRTLEAELAPQRDTLYGATLHELGRLLLETNRAGEAIEILERALHVTRGEPTYAPIWVWRDLVRAQGVINGPTAARCTYDRATTWLAQCRAANSDLAGELGGESAALLALPAPGHCAPPGLPPFECQP